MPCLTSPRFAVYRTLTSLYATHILPCPALARNLGNPKPYSPTEVHTYLHNRQDVWQRIDGVVHGPQQHCQDNGKS